MPPIAPVSPSTCQGSSACRSSSLTPSYSTSPQNGKRNSACASYQSERKSKPVRAQVGEHVEEILPDEMRQHEPVVQRRAPARQRPVQRIAPQPREDRADQQLLGEAHARVRRHLEAAELDQPEPAGRAVGRIELVDADFRAMGVAGHVGQKVAHQPVDQPRRRRLAVAGLRDLRQRDLEFVKAVVARLVDARRLAGRADEQAGEEIAEARMPQPIDDEALSRSGRRRNGLSSGVAAADHDVVAAAGAGVPAVDHELVGAEPRQPRLLVDRLGRRDAFAPVRRRDGC